MNGCILSRVDVERERQLRRVLELTRFRWLLTQFPGWTGLMLTNHTRHAPCASN